MRAHELLTMTYSLRPLCYTSEGRLQEGTAKWRRMSLVHESTENRKDPLYETRRWLYRCGILLQKRLLPGRRPSKRADLRRWTAYRVGIAWYCRRNWPLSKHHRIRPIISYGRATSTPYYASFVPITVRSLLLLVFKGTVACSPVCVDSRDPGSC